MGVFILPALQGERLSPGKVPGIERRDGMVLPKPPISPAPPGKHRLIKVEAVDIARAKVLLGNPREEVRG